MTRSRAKGYVVRFSELVQYFRRLEGTSGRNALVESWSEHMRQLARLMGGDLSVESVEGAGARFVVTLPLRSAEGLKGLSAVK